MIAYIVLGHNNVDEVCNEGQLCVWLKLMFLHDLIYSIHLITLLVIIFIHRYRGSLSRWQNLDQIYTDYQQSLQVDGFNMNQQQPALNGFFISDTFTRNNWFNSFLQKSTMVFYSIMFIQGNLLIFYNKEQYIPIYPNHFYMALVFVVMGYFYLGIPLFFFASICLCMPFMLVLYLILRRRGTSLNRGLDEDTIQNLPTNKLKDVERREQDVTLDCCICLQEYEEDEEIITLPCNKHHHFHAECIREWVKINGVCPICKCDLEQLILRMDNLEQQQQQQ